MPTEEPGVNELTNRALLLWARVTGVDEKSYHDKRSMEDLNESRDLDPTGLTTFMMLRGSFEDYLKNYTFSAYKLILDPDSVVDTLSPMRELRDLLESDVVVNLIADFQEKLRESAKHYGVEDMEAYEEWLQNKYHLALVRRDALRSLEKMEAHQFTQGDPDERAMKVGSKVYEVWNINSLVRALAVQNLPGISTVLVRDPDVMFSFFCFGIKNGDTITVLTDRDTAPHPDFKKMSRRPDRSLERRAMRHWFPYHLLKLEVSADGKRLYAERRNQLVPTNDQAVELADFASLAAPEVIWLTLVFELISEKYGKQNHQEEELSYTGEMVVEPQALVGESSALVLAGKYKPLELPPLTREDVTAESTASQWVRERAGHNAWLVDRYGDQVPAEAFNVVGQIAAEQAQLCLPPEAQEHPREETRLRPGYWDRDKPQGVQLKHLDPVMTFGTAAEIDKDRVWTARVNQMRVIQRLAEREYYDTRDEVLEWWKEHVYANGEMLSEAAARGDIEMPSWKFRIQGAGFETKKGDPVASIVRKELSQKVDSACPFTGSKAGFVMLCGAASNSWYANQTECFDLPPKTASVWTIIEADCPEAIAFLAGVTVAELPWPLQRWYSDAPYSGNQILNRLDPEDWVLKNPWVYNSGHLPGIRPMVVVAHSKTAIHKRRKAMGLEKRTPQYWKDIKKDKGRHRY